MEFKNVINNNIEDFPLYGPYYESSSTSLWKNPFPSSPYVGQIFHDMVSEDSEIQDIMINLLRDEGPLLQGAEQAENLPSFFPLMYDRVFGEDTRTNDELRELALKSIEGLKDLKYIIGNPVLDQSMGGFVLGEYLPADTNESWAPRSSESIPDSVFVSSPTKWEYTIGGLDENYMDYTTDDMLKTLIHEGLLHGMGIYHPNTPLYNMLASGWLPESYGMAANYDTATEDIYNILSESDKERLIYHLLPEHMIEARKFTNIPAKQIY